MSICEFFIDREEPIQLVDKVIHDMEGIGDTISGGTMGWVSCYRRLCRSMDPTHFECHYICLLLVDRDVELPCHTANRRQKKNGRRG